jgi:DNA-binding CsgD family transcriptional regulator
MITVKKELDETDFKILHKIKDGKSYKETAYELSITINAVTNRLHIMRKYFGCTNNIRLIIELTERKILVYDR